MKTKSLPIITIDGPAGVGKTTLATLLAEKLQIPYLDTGAMFRTLALELGENADQMDGAELLKRVGRLKFSLSGSGKETRLLCNGSELGDAIRNEKIGALASKLAKNPVIRNWLLLEQRDIANSTSLVCEGRDMGTVVFPNAENKFFLEADPLVRARRRFLQYQEKGQSADLKELENSIRQRDDQDRTRSIAPLKAAEDAIIIDTSSLEIPQLLDLMLSHISLS